MPILLIFNLLNAELRKFKINISTQKLLNSYLCRPFLRKGNNH